MSDKVGLTPDLERDIGGAPDTCPGRHSISDPAGGPRLVGHALLGTTRALLGT